eukprot:scpid68855/ scgid6362/ Chitobiosyldiphosphodolichol beta-mannosyltransferase; Asparagine-linked glycosylation protein 1 homolog; Beta-1,4-mannosyltransferase; GDP-Man:GlcNAc2-PP-dolichol mannosyltransferase; GDP-mannose-dolichol diphosphochitobiose mannosyltransferase
MLFEACILLPVLALLWKRFRPRSKRACVLVLGDFGRSPRMQYHCWSLSRAGFDVDVVAYGGSEPHGSVRDDPKIKVALLRSLPAAINNLPRVAVYFVKVLLQSLQLFCTLYLWLPRASHLLLQNPPAIPTMAVAWLVCRLRGTEFVVDWHNYGHTILSMALPRKHPLVRFAVWYERFFGRMADNAVCVTNAMREDLARNWDVTAVTMHDRPPALFRPLPLDERHHLFMQLKQQYSVFADPDGDANRTVFTQLDTSGMPEYRSGRPALLVSSTSWTEDEDFGVLLDALKIYEERSLTDLSLPPLVCVITGKGPQKQFYLDKVKELKFTRISVETPWLEAADYPRLLGSADLGVSLHTSSSGLDLPMKVVDMFGCGLPVLAHDFKCLGELVRHKHNGMVFKSSGELAEQLRQLLGDPDQSLLLDFRENLVEFRLNRWEQHWTANVAPLFQD